MKIHSLTYEDTIQKWGFSKINFFNLTLLVGISGVGKTQILNSILRIKRIANGKSLNGIKWEILFSIDENNYSWFGEFERIEKYENIFPTFLGDEDEKPIKPKILKEVISVNNERLTHRKENNIYFKDTKLPKLSSDESLISIFKEEEDVKVIYEAFRKIVFRDYTDKTGGLSIRLGENEEVLSKYKSLEEIRNSDLDTNQKLYCLYENQNETFLKIVENYCDVFPQVENVKIEPIKGDKLPQFFANISIIQFKELGVDKWITQNEMSSGMLRTFFHISEMFLLKEGTVVLIDEFENSLGVNCIDILTEDLMFENDRLQFIATSHHPYIINKIPYNYWKIVTRKGGEIKTYNAKDFDLGASSHERFLNLVNLPQYKRGIESLT